MTTESHGNAALPANRLFLLGAGFSKAAGLPLADELLPLARDVARRWLSVKDYNHLDAAIGRYEEFVNATNPGTPFNLEAFGAWLDWQHVLRLKGSDTFSEYGNEAGLQLRWAIGKVLHDLTPKAADLPAVYLEFARRLTTSGRVLTLNYDLILERSLEAVGRRYRRFPGRYSEIHENYNVWDPDEPKELIIAKLHGSLDWTYFTQRDDSALGLRHLVEGPRPADDPLLRIAIIPTDRLPDYYATRASWSAHPTLLMAPSSAKPLAASPLIPLWDGVGNYAYMLAGFNVIGCSLPPGDPYVLQLAYDVGTDDGAARVKNAARPENARPWAQAPIKVVDRRTTLESANELRARFQFLDGAQTEFILDGFTSGVVDRVFST